MTVSVRSYLVAGAAAATATTVALAPIQIAPQDVAVPAHPVSAQPHLTQAMVDLLAAASRTTSALPVPAEPPTGGGTATGSAPEALAAGPGDVTTQNAASDFVTSSYQFIQGWVDWGVNYGVDLAYWAGGWGVPFAGLAGAQVDIFYYDLIRPIANTVVYNLINPVLNDPLNLGVWASGIGDVGWAVAAAAWNTVVAEADYFLGWVLPPLPPLPLPPLPFAAAATEISALQVTTPVEPATEAVAGDEDFAKLVKAFTEGPLTGPIGRILADAGLGKITDPSDQGPLQSLADGVESGVSDAAEAIGSAAAELGGAQERATEVAEVPDSIKTALNADTTTGKATDRTEATRPARPAPRPARSLANGLKDLKGAVGKAVTDAGKATETVRRTVRDARTAGKPEKRDRLVKRVKAGKGERSDAKSGGTTSGGTGD
ncbi:hypothetical protein ACWDTP_19985 [Mycobacterium sp. NPDC003449]